MKYLVRHTVFLFLASITHLHAQVILTPFQSALPATVQISAPTTMASNPNHILIGYETRTGALKSINHQYLQVNIRLKSTEKKPRHFLGLVATNRNEGPFIAQPKGHIQYTLKLDINKDISISAGTSIGFVQYTFKSAGSKPQFADASPDMNFGLGIKRKNSELHIASNHLLNPSVQPLNAEFKFNRFTQLVFNHQKEISTSLTWRHTSQAKISTAFNTTILLSNVFVFKDSYGAGLNLSYPLGFGAFGQFRWEKYWPNLLFFLAYNSTFASESSKSRQVIEITIGIDLNKKAIP